MFVPTYLPYCQPVWLPGADSVFQVLAARTNTIFTAEQRDVTLCIILHGSCIMFYTCIFSPLFLLSQLHGGCRENYPRKCPLGQCRLSILPPTAISSIDSDGYWEGTRPPGTSPLLVYVNTKSGDNQVP